MYYYYMLQKEEEYTCTRTCGHIICKSVSASTCYYGVVEELFEKLTELLPIDLPRPQLPRAQCSGSGSLPLGCPDWHAASVLPSRTRTHRRD